jgi:hypothetical protein
MAKITPSPLVSKIQGKIGSLIFQVWKKANIVRNMPLTIHNPSTPAQALRRNVFQQLVSAWRNLDNQSKAAWEDYAQGLPGNPQENIGTTQLINPMGGNMTGFNAFLGVNGRLSSAGLPFVIVPPITSIAGPNEIFLGVTMTPASIPITVNMTSANMVIGSVIRLFAKTNWPGGHVYLWANHVIAAPDIGPGETSNVTFMVHTARCGHTAAYADVGLFFFLGKTMQFQADIIGTDGYKSPSSNIIAQEISVSVPAAVETLYGLLEANYRTDVDSYLAALGREGVTSVQIWATGFFSWVVANALDWTDYEAVANLTGADFPDTIADLIDAGHLPTVEGYEDYNNNFFPA